MLPAVPASYHFQTTFKNSKKLNITNIVQLSKPSNMRSLENSQSSLNSLCTLSPLLSGTDAPPRSWPVVPASYHFLKTFKNSKKINLPDIVQLSKLSTTLNSLKHAFRHRCSATFLACSASIIPFSENIQEL